MSLSSIAFSRCLYLIQVVDDTNFFSSFHPDSLLLHPSTFFLPNMCHNPPNMFKPLNPNAQSFRPENNAFAITFGLFHPLPLLPWPPLSQAWPALLAFHDVPNYIYDAGSQPEPVYGLPYLGRAEIGVPKFKGLEVYETFRCQKRVDRRRRFSNREPITSVKCRESKVWMPKNGVSGGVRPTVHDVTRSRSNNIVVNKNIIPDEFQRGKSWKKNTGRARIIPFPATIEKVISSEKTTVMIKNIPNQFIRDDLIAILDKHCRDENKKAESQSCKSAYDFLYLPMDFRRFWYQRKMTNLGYAFVNFTSSRAAFRFFYSFHKHVWAVTENKKTCEVTLAELQGKEALIESFTNRIFWCEYYSFLPVVFEAPRDGSNFSTFVTVGIRVPRAPPKRPRKSS